MAKPKTCDLASELIDTTDYLHTATNLRPLVTGKKGNRILGIGGEWYGKVVGDAPDDGAQVTVARYDHPYELTADAKKRASALLQCVKLLRK